MVCNEGRQSRNCRPATRLCRFSVRPEHCRRAPKESRHSLHTEANMQKLSSLLFTTLISISIAALAHESMAQTSAAPSAARVVSTNDNTRSAGRIEGDVLNVRLYDGVGG